MRRYSKTKILPVGLSLLSPTLCCKCMLLMMNIHPHIVHTLQLRAHQVPRPVCEHRGPGVEHLPAHEGEIGFVVERPWMGWSTFLLVGAKLTA